jgi:hypothetical protein
VRLPIQSPPVLRETYSWEARPRAAAGGASASSHGVTSQSGGFMCTCSGMCNDTVFCNDGEVCTCTNSTASMCTCESLFTVWQGRVFVHAAVPRVRR